MKTTLGIFSLSLFLSCVLTGINAKDKSEFYYDERELIKYLQPDDIGRNRTYDKLNHSDPYLCTRDCNKDSKARLCYYIFNVEHYSTMGPACRDCSTKNTTDCHHRQCIHADGFERSVISINRQIPGPTINVCYGDRIVVDVINKLATSALTIHWHGVLQQSTPWMDGVPYVTQCPIQPNSMFRYDFPADTNGTLFYHAHMAHLHANGVYGALIVRHANTQYDPNLKLHDFDLPSHTIQVSDWNHLPAEALFPGFYKNESHYPTKHDLHLINGQGWYKDSLGTKNVSLAEFHVQCGKRYRFRIIASTTSTCCFKFAIQSHSMSVIAVDGYPCEATDVNTLVMSSGQRTDVVIKVNNGTNCQKKSFLIVVKGMDICENRTNAQTAHLIYDNATTLPTWPRSLSTIHNLPPYLNNHDLKCNDSDNVCGIFTLPLAKGFLGFILDEFVPANRTFNIRPGFHQYTFHELFETNTYSPFYVPLGPNLIVAATVNNVSGIVPPVPLLTQENEIPKDIRICHNATCEKNESFCQCINILEVELNMIVDIRFEITDIKMIHPIHLHGHHFTIVTLDHANVTADFLGSVQRDTAHIPLDGSARIRFVANNPGYWIMHCHFSPHLEGGMYVIFKVGNSKNFKPPPIGFPRCGDFKPSVKKL